MHKIGLVYQDQWGKSLNVDKEWNDYEINQVLMERIEREMKLDEITYQGNQKEKLFDLWAMGFWIGIFIEDRL